MAEITAETGIVLPNGAIVEINMSMSRQEFAFISPRFDSFKNRLLECTRKFTLAVNYPDSLVELAQDLLGEKHVVDWEMTSANLEQAPPSGTTVVCPTLEDLEEAAAQNLAGEHDWYLLYISGLSLWDLQEGFPTFATAPSFSNVIPASERAAIPGVDEKPKPGYYLVDLKGLFANMDWQEQETAIAALGADYQRTPAAIFVQALFLLYRTDYEYLFPEGAHWTSLLSPKGERIALGFFDRLGLEIIFGAPEYADPVYFVSLVRKPGATITIPPAPEAVTGVPE